MSKRCRELQIGDTIFEIDQWFLAGARAYREGESFRDCPHRDGSYRFDQWQYGHEIAAEVDQLYPPVEFWPVSKVLDELLA